MTFWDLKSTKRLSMKAMVYFELAIKNLAKFILFETSKSLFRKGHSL